VSAILGEAQVVTRIENQVVVERPVVDVFRFARQWRNIPRYFDYIQEVRPLTEAPDGLGTRLSVRLKFLGREMISEWETVEYEQDAGWTVSAPLMGVDSRKFWRFEPVGESTQVVFTLEYEAKPALVGPLADMLLIRRSWDKLYKRGMQNLKRLVEQEALRQTAPEP
jgi:uncharacterized membrane protein